MHSFSGTHLLSTNVRRDDTPTDVHIIPNDHHLRGPIKQPYLPSCRDIQSGFSDCHAVDDVSDNPTRSSPRR
ncbi:hypothetical protein PILCRDRAFT_823642 [Piloderma croceum F 1598]|uniref:Uncharacterized protein n=1 Tax=Piloderma croceum (strain F 1598) TaxID=765440 RepID=A0A0C3BPX6_PILCF|nr:hypothetical protein PILCRDRAFT_823642 [Piloderma croceum F 1598]